ncbi:ABC transporter permease [Arthrobacter sp. S2(2024)]|uniref:ABC transporter permease n=1 Tax=Arthrobacter sp. S2(2024) TaxID=3111911 RepID=UPI002FCCA193
MAVVATSPNLAGVRTRRANWAVCASIGWVALLVLLAFAGPLLAPYSPTAIDLANRYSDPSMANPFGTDETGRDIFSRVLAAVPTTIAGPFFVVLVSASLGTLLALIAAWFGKFTDGVISRGFDILFAFPGLVLAILAAAMFGGGFWAPVLALSLAFTPVFGRILRATAIRERNLPYVSALMVQGQSRMVIAVRHILPNLFPALAVQGAVAFSYALLDLSAISYLGLGQRPPAADWGLLIAQGQNGILAGHPQQAVIASILVLITVLAMNVIGDALSNKFEIGER